MREGTERLTRNILWVQIFFYISHLLLGSAYCIEKKVKAAKIPNNKYIPVYIYVHYNTSLKQKPNSITYYINYTEAYGI